jgi:PAS domain S-box-containing protein
MPDVYLVASADDPARERPVLDSREARGLFEQVAETTPDILYVYDVRLRRHVYINRRVRDLLGYGAEELAGFGGDLTARLTHPDDLALLEAHFASLADLGDSEIASVEHRMLHADGAYRWLSCRGTVFARGRDGSVSHVIGQVRDITEQRNMVDALRESDARLQAILDNVPALVWMAAPDGRGIDFNKPVIAFTGLTREQLLADGWSNVVHPDDRARCVEVYRSHLNRRDSFRMEYRMRRADGEYRWIDDTGIPRYTPSGEFLGYVGCCVDVTNRRQAEQALRESEESFRAMADTVPDILYVAGRQRDCLFVNARFYEYTGLTPGSGLGAGWLQVVHPEDLAAATTVFRRSAPDVSVHELRLRAADGQYRWFVCRTRTLRDANGLVLRRFGVASDIDDLKRVQQELQLSNARLGAIIGSISDCYYTLDRDWRITAMNANAARWLGVSAAKAIGSLYGSMCSEGKLRPYIRKAMETGVPVRAELESVVNPGRWGSVHIYPFAGGVNIFFRDISERIRAEQAERERHALLQSTIDALSAHVAVIDRGGTIVAVNAAWRRFAAANGYRADDHGVGANYLRICNEVQGESSEAASVAAGLQAMLDGGSEMLRVEYACHGPAATRWFQLRATRFGSGDDTRFVLAHEDVTEIKRAEQELRRLAGRLLALQDEERRRIARELHDSTAQNLVALAFNLDRLERRAPLTEGVRSAVIADSRALIERSLKELRTLSYLLHPPALDDAGLVPAIRSFIDGFSRRSGIKVDMKLPGRMARLPRDAESAIFRIVQEALANVHRHSGSATAAVRLSRSRERVVLEIVDRGAGIAVASDASAARMNSLGVGIPGMRARLRQLNGDLEIQSAAGQGTTIRAVVPVV